ncbi:MAG: flavin reductase, partial [Eggerthellaceae bacterium]|nr:flavin reductase [Eggerthellaceae bacterium]
MGQGIDKQAFHQFSYGLFLLTSRVGDRDNGCIINTAIQAASEPRMVSICCIKGTCTQEMIDVSGLFNVSVLAESTPNGFFAHFGMQSGHDVDKFEESTSADVLGDTVRRSANGLTYVSTANAFFSCKVVSREDLGSHIMYAGEVVEAACLSDEPSITYDYYRTFTKKGRKPEPVQAAAATSAEVAAEPAADEAPIVAWQCTICGYVFEGTQLPDDFICPLCKHGAEDFEPIRASNGANAAAVPAAAAQVDSQAESVGTQEDVGVEQGGSTMDKWVCSVCGYIYEGEQPPEACPVCKAPASAFKKVEGELKLAAEHEYGIYAKTVKDNADISAEDKAYIFEQLK